MRRTESCLWLALLPCRLASGTPPRHCTPRVSRLSRQITSAAITPPGSAAFRDRVARDDSTRAREVGFCFAFLCHPSSCVSCSSLSLSSSSSLPSSSSCSSSSSSSSSSGQPRPRALSIAGCRCPKPSIVGPAVMVLLGCTPIPETWGQPSWYYWVEPYKVYYCRLRWKYVDDKHIDSRTHQRRMRDPARHLGVPPEGDPIQRSVALGCVRAHSWCPVVAPRAPQQE